MFVNLHNVDFDNCIKILAKLYESSELLKNNMTAEKNNQLSNF